MKEFIILEKLKTRSGESSLMIILIFAAILIFVMLPITALIFERGLVKLAVQEITDQIDMTTFQIYQNIEMSSFSQLKLDTKSEIVEKMNKQLLIEHPQVEEIEIVDVTMIHSEFSMMSLEIEITMNPTLYRSFYNLNKSYSMMYSVLLPIDGEN
ncbi:MAG: hypothetical protein JEZ08_14145 [Clostridiales bacterium]|nr:hypothetical protein [Clostridiales bacterium]